MGSPILSPKMLGTAVFAFLLLTASNGLSLTKTDGVQVPKLGDPFSDNYIDEVLANLRDMVITNNLDPADLPDAETGFSDTVLGITWHGSAKVYNGKFWGLSTIARAGDTSLTVEGTTATLTANIGILSGARAHYDAKAEFMGITVHADADATVGDIQIYLAANMDVGDLNSGLQLTDFHISHVGHINVNISGLGPLDWILELLVDFIDAFLKDWIIGMLEGPLKDLIQSILNDLIPDIPSKIIGA